MPELIGSFFILKVITLLSLRRDAWRGMGRVAGYGTLGGVYGTAGEGDFRAQKKSGNLRR